MAVENKQYHFINTIVDELYVDKRDDDKLLEPFVQEIKKYSCNNDCVSNEIRSTYCYYSLKDRNSLPVIFFSKSSRKANAVSICSYSQCAAWFYIPELGHNFFDTVFNTAFMTEDQVDDFASSKGNISFKDGKDNILDSHNDTIYIEKNALKAVISGVMLRWMINGKQIKIAVPSQEKDYNSYVMRAVKEIYSYFPPAMRVETGFISYLKPGKMKDFPRIHIVFVPEQEADTETILLNGSTPTAYAEIMNDRGLNIVKGFIDHVAELDKETERAAFIDAVFSDIENSGDEKLIKAFSPIRYKNYSNALEILDAKGSKAELIDNWVRFAATGIGNLPKLEERIWEKINNGLTEKDLSAYCAEKFKNCRSAEDAVAFAVRASKVCRDKPELKDIIWAGLNSALVNETYSDEDIYKALAGANTELSTAFGAKETEGLRNTFADKCIGALVSKGEKALRDQMVRKPEIAAYKTSAAGIVSEVKEAADKFMLKADSKKVEEKLKVYAFGYVADEVEAAFNKLLTVPANTPNELQQRLNELGKLNHQLETDDACVRDCEKYAAVTAKIRRETNECNRKLNTSGSIRRDIESRISTPAIKNYFEKLEKAGESTNQLEKTDVDTLKVFVKKFRPKTYDEYKAEFHNCYNLELNGNTISKTCEFARLVIASDLPELLGEYRFEVRGSSPEEMLKCMAEAKQQMSQFANGRAPLFKMYGKNVGNADELEMALSLTKKSGVTLKPKIVQALIEDGVYSGKHLIALRNLYEDCETEGQSELFNLAVKGGFKDTDATTYKRFFEDYLNHVMKKARCRNRLDALEIVENQKDKCKNVDSTARRALDELRKDIETAEGKKTPGKTIAIIALAALLAGSAAFGTVTFLKNKELKEFKKDAQQQLNEKDISLMNTEDRLYAALTEIANGKADTAKSELVNAIQALSSGYAENPVETVKQAKEILNSAIEALKFANEKTGFDETKQLAFDRIDDAFTIIENEFATNEIRAEGLGIAKDAFDISIGEYDYLYEEEAVTEVPTEERTAAEVMLETIMNRQLELESKLHERRVQVVGEKVYEAINAVNNEDISPAAIAIETSQRALLGLEENELAGLVDNATKTITEAQNAKAERDSANDALRIAKDNLENYYTEIAQAQEEAAEQTNDDGAPATPSAVYDEAEVQKRQNAVSDAETDLAAKSEEYNKKLESAKAALQAIFDFFNPPTEESPDLLEIIDIEEGQI